MTAPAVDMAALATQARQLADAAPAGSLDRKAYNCCAVVLRDFRTIAGARRALRADVGPADVRGAALQRLDELAGGPGEPPGEDPPGEDTGGQSGRQEVPDLSVVALEILGEVLGVFGDALRNEPFRRASMIPEKALELAGEALVIEAVDIDLARDLPDHEGVVHFLAVLGAMYLTERSVIHQRGEARRTAP